VTVEQTHSGVSECLMSRNVRSMGPALISTAACNEANALALQKARLGAGARITGCRRSSIDSYDLAYTVSGAHGDEKTVVVTDRSLRARLKRRGLFGTNDPPVGRR
jgi:hypothetical protein